METLRINFTNEELEILQLFAFNAYKEFSDYCQHKSMIGKGLDNHKEKLNGLHKKLYSPTENIQISQPQSATFLYEQCAKLVPLLENNIGEIVLNRQEIASHLRGLLGQLGTAINEADIAPKNSIVRCWTIDDVKEAKEDLTDEQARAVLEHYQICCTNNASDDYEVIGLIGDELFPESGDNS